MGYLVLSDEHDGLRRHQREVLGLQEKIRLGGQRLLETDSGQERPGGLHYPGELFFIPNPTGIEEDDGVLVTIVFDGEREQSYVLVLDGQTFTEINRSYLPYNVPFSFHGNWFPELQ